MKGRVARAIRKEIEAYKQDAGSPLGEAYDRITDSYTKREVLVPVNHTRRAKKQVIKAGDLRKGVTIYGQKLVNDISAVQRAEGNPEKKVKLHEKKTTKRSGASKRAIQDSMRREAFHRKKLEERIENETENR